MAALNFPNSPSTNDLHTENGLTFKWNGTIWKKVGPAYTDTTNLNVTGIGTIAGNFHVGGVLTYEDVKNVDSVGIITARSGIDVTGNSEFSGSASVSGDLDVAADIRHIGDTDTRLRFETDTISARTAGSERLRITSGGNIGIGLINPEAFNSWANRLVVGDGSSNQGITVFSTGRGTMWFTDAANTSAEGLITYQHSTNHFEFNTAGTEKLRITSDGKINTKGSASSVTAGCLSGGIHLVHANAEGTPTFTGGEVAIFQRNYNSAQSSEISIVSGTASKSTINFGDKDDVNIGMIQYENNNNALVFTTNTAEKLRITSDGQVNIGTTANYGTIGTAAAFQIYGSNAGGNVSQNIINHASANASSTCDINIWQNYRLANRIIFGRENANNWQSSAAGAASYTAFYTNNAGTVAEKLRIHADGRVTTPINSNRGGIGMVGAFRARVTSVYDFPSGTRKIILGTEEFDANGWFDHTTNYRYTPLCRGWYQLHFHLQFKTGINNNAIEMQLYPYFNGASTPGPVQGWDNNHGNYAYNSWSTIMYFNGTTDYVEFYGNCSHTTDVSTATHMMGYLVHPVA